MSALKIGALFAGYGGLDLAVEDVFGARPAWLSEFDKAPSKILATRYPDIPNHGDVTKIDWASVEPVDIITGGSPCQDLSHAGKRAGMKAGTRSGLWASMCDAIDIIRPSLVVWENVRGALSATAAAGDVESCEFCVGDPGEPPLRALGRVLGDLAELGYDAAWCGLRAADVGAPHGRYRIFVLAWPAADADDNRRREQLASRLAAAQPWSTDPAGAAPHATVGGRGPQRDVGLRAAGLGGQEASLRPGLTWGSREWRELTRAEVLAGDWGDWPTEARLLKTPTSQLAENGGSQHPDKRKAGGHGPTLADEVEHLLPTPAVADAQGGRKTRSGARNGELLLNGLAAADAFGQYGPAITRWESVLGRPAPSPTEPTGKGGAQRLSPRFVEWMMGLPDGWVTDIDITRNEQLKALGNGVVPQQAAAALRHLASIRAQSLGAAA